jgi:hypothetical protein
MCTRTFRSGSRASTSLKNSMPSSPTSCAGMEVRWATAPSGSVSVKSGSGSPPASTLPSPVLMVNRADPASRSSATRASRERGFVALRAAGDVEKKRASASLLGVGIPRV